MLFRSSFWFHSAVTYVSINPICFGAALVLLYVSALVIYRVFFSPLAAVPGPWYAAVSDGWMGLNTLRLRRCRAIDDLLKKYGPIVRIGPNKVAFLDSATMKTIYSTSSRLAKSDFYKGMQMYVFAVLNA